MTEGKNREKARDYLVGQTNTGRMLRTSRFKYNAYFVDGKSQEQLFDISKDPGEMKNLALDKGHKSVVEEHRRRLLEWTIANHDEKGRKYLEAV